MTQQIIYHAGTGTYLPLNDCAVVEVPATVCEDEDVEAYIAQPRPTRRRRVEIDVSEHIAEPINSLFLVRGEDIDGENQDLFVVAPNGIRAVTIWNEHCVENEWPRDDMDDHDPARTVEPSNVRIILSDVSGTEYDGIARAIDWHTLPDAS